MTCGCGRADGSDLGMQRLHEGGRAAVKYDGRVRIPGQLVAFDRSDADGRDRRDVARGAARRRDAAARGLRRAHRRDRRRAAPARTTGRRCRRSCCAATGSPTQHRAAQAGRRRPRPRLAARRAAPSRSTSRAREVELHDGERVAFDGLVIATGSTPRRLPNQPEPRRRVHAAHARRRARARASCSTRGPKVVVIGAGFIGAEVAATCRTRGLDVTVLEALPQPMVRGLGPSSAR